MLLHVLQIFIYLFDFLARLSSPQRGAQGGKGEPNIGYDLEKCTRELYNLPCLSNVAFNVFLEWKTVETWGNSLGEEIAILRRNTKDATKD